LIPAATNFSVSRGLVNKNTGSSGSYISGGSLVDLIELTNMSLV
jgi:hypothetical protein